MIVIIDYNTGNIGSIQNMLKKIGHPSTISSGANDIVKAEKLILPGVGAFDSGIKNLKNLDLIDVINEMVIQKKTPFLGICLGMQLLTKRSEEGKLPGLGFIDANTVKFQNYRSDKNLRIPHMGWNTTQLLKDSHIFKTMPENFRFYFVHSYYVECNNKEDILATTYHGHHFVSAFQKDNIFGVQFHPEKSHKFGMQLLKNFLEQF